MKPVARWVKRLGRWVAALVGIAALLLALGIGAFRLAIDLLPGYQQRIVERVREATGLTLEFDSVYARIGRYGPELVFRGARVLPASGDEALVSAESGLVGFIMWAAFVAIWIAIAFWPARVAGRKGHSFFGYFVLSLFFFPLALILAYLVKDRGVERQAPPPITFGPGPT